MILCKNNVFYIRTVYLFLNEELNRTQGEDLSTIKIFNPPPHPQAHPQFMLTTVLRPGVILGLCGFVVLLRSVSCWVMPCSLFSRFSVLAPIVITSLGEERELVYALLVHLFVYCAHVNFRPSSLLLGINHWLRLMIVALPGLFY